MDKFTKTVGREYKLFQYVGAPIPEGKKSLAYSIAYRAADRTLTDAEVNQLHGAPLG
jgi:phenylalanyl-tRNA synthetase beta chain